MKRVFWILVVALLIVTTFDASAQRWKLRRYEMDVYLAGVSFYGDIGLAGRPVANMFNGFRPSAGITPRFLIRENFAVSLDLGYMMFGGSDETGSTHARVYTMSGHAFQHVARMEYFLIGGASTRGRGAIYNRRGMVNNYNRIYVYLFGGVGGLLSNATVLDAEGNEPIDNPGYYPGTHYTACFPLGGGIKMSLDPRWSIGFEVGYQFTLSDKVDGYSSEFSNYNDSYYLFNLKAIYRIRNDRYGRPIFRNYYR